MKFEINKDKIRDLGLIVKRGNSNNTVLFWDENEQAASYIVEVFRCVEDNVEAGFLSDYVAAKCSRGGAKPVCTIAVERNKFYHSINDLPCGYYIVCLKVENRNGEVVEESAPYCFNVEDYAKKAEEQANGIANAIYYSGCGSVLG